MKKYYWILVDTLAKTLEIVEAASCQRQQKNKLLKVNLALTK